MANFGDYTVATESEEFRIYPTNRFGETIPVTINRKTILFTHKSGDSFVLKHHLYRGQWRWNDSRCGSVTEEYITQEVARMLFKKDVAQAQQFIQKVA